ncbi:MAG: hypothetical protein GX558_07460 [Clostridiales bacterium]|nr:hypothetical protein [Clostridiales bacterium]
MFDEFDRSMMGEALRQAAEALADGEVPVGAAVAHGGRLIAVGRNGRERLGDPTAHAEVLALRRAAQVLGGWRLDGCALYVTLEPCPMCAGALVEGRVSRLVFGARDGRYGCAGSVYRIPEDPAFPHFCRSEGGLMERECADLLAQFFARARVGGAGRPGAPQPGGFSHFTAIVRDLPAAAALWRAIGGRVVYESCGRGHSLAPEVFVDVGGAWLCLMQGEPADGASYRHAAFRVAEADLDALAARVEAAGGRVLPGRPRMPGEGRSLYFRDPDGNLFEFHAGRLADRLAAYAAADDAE